MRLSDLDALKEAIETYDKFACLSDTRLVPFRRVSGHEDDYEPYVKLRDIRNAIDHAPPVDFEKLGESLRCQIRAEYGSCDDCELSCPRNELIKLLGLARQHSEWIPVSERLPDKDGVYLVTLECIEDSEIVNEIDIAWFVYSEKDDNNYGFHKAYIVTAWQELPEPYEK